MLPLTKLINLRICIIFLVVYLIQGKGQKVFSLPYRRSSHGG
jgi:hypothetical protein